MTCSDLYERFFVYVDGGVGLCCADQQGWFNLGNVLDEDPVVIFNRGKFAEHRQAMEEGRIATLEHCSNCSLIMSRLERQYLDVKRVPGGSHVGTESELKVSR
jgi:hypothetical protein